MDEKFWLNRWEKDEIGFHKNEPHHYLQRFFNFLRVTPGDRLLVPLCGKSLDMTWLHGKGLEVVGIELSHTALQAFVHEQRLRGVWGSMAGFPCFTAEGYRLYRGNFFDLGLAALGRARAVYDRGALVALPGEMRVRYAQHLAGLLPRGSRGLLISYAYDQRETYGPPFSVNLQEIELLFGDHFRIELLVEDDVLWSHQGLAARGVTQLTEFAILLIRK